MGHSVAAWGVRVDGTSSRGLWPPVGGGLCSLALKGQRPFGPRVVVAASPQFLKSALRIYLSASYGKISILLTGSLRSPPPIRLRRTSPCSGGRINRSMLSCRDMAPWLNTHSPTTKWGGKVVAPATKGGMHFLARQGGCMVFPRAKARL